MKKICFLFLTALFSTVTMAQDAKSVLDKAAANITVKEGVKANFTMTGGIGHWQCQWNHPHQRQEVPCHHIEGHSLV